MTASKQQVVNTVLESKNKKPVTQKAQAWAATNIALCKYWGKRDERLNLPLTDSLSVMLPKHGVDCDLALITEPSTIVVNGAALDLTSTAAINLQNYLALFLESNYQLELNFNIPVAAGFASSAACYASITKMLNNLFDWNLSSSELSILARLGSGSAARSIEPGFSVWQAGSHPVGLDSFSKTLPQQWPELRIGLCVLSSEKKPISSREGMKRTRETSLLYRAWPEQVKHDMPILLDAIKNHDFKLLGETAEHNAMSMHATMESAWPPLVYTLAETRSLQQLIWGWRQDGKAIYFTQDAGPNLKLLFLQEDEAWLKKQLPELQVIAPFDLDCRANARNDETNTADTTHDQVILVDKNDNEIGTADKLQAHKDGLLHRAISVFVMRGNKILLQQRADNKYHSAGLWSNTCCSHPRPGEDTKEAAQRRLQEEMGIACELAHCGSFIYRSDYDNGLSEHELDHVFLGHLDGPNDYELNPSEAKAAKWVDAKELLIDLTEKPNNYSSWLKQALETLHRIK